MFGRSNIPRELKITNLPKGITSIEIADDLEGTPAKCWRSSGRTVVCRRKFVPLPKEQQDMILGHEAGHIVLDTTDEYEADDYAIDYCIAQGNSLKQTIYAMTDVLSYPHDRPMQRAEQILRTNRQYNRLLEYDRQNRQKQKRKPMCKTTHVADRALQKEIDAVNVSNFFGWFNKEKRAAKNNKTNAQASLIEDRGEAKVLEAQAKLELAKQGIPTGIAGLGQGLGGMMGGQRTPSTEREVASEPKPILGMKPAVFYAVLAITVVVVAVAIWFFTRKK